ncbi:hypothetical protein LMH73_023300 [Vibrio splendidus]|nr:hypothetical protein [Vibrio splendidus]MCC4883218.1 hypothetical protein [Vibrio splendidus]
MRNKSPVVKAKLQIVIDALSICTYRKKPYSEKANHCQNALSKVVLADLTSEERADDQLVRGLIALETIASMKPDVDTDILSDMARKSLRKIMPLWAYEHGGKHFDQIPDRLMDEVEKLTDTSWHNNALPSFEFGYFQVGDDEYAISAWIGFDGESYEEDCFVFAMSLSKDGEQIEDLSHEVFLSEFGLPPRTEFGARGTLSDEDADKLCKFLQNYGSKNIHEKLLAHIKEITSDIF